MIAAMNEFCQIKASAGSGKTYTLTSSFLSLLAGASGASWKKAPSGCALPGESGDYGWQEILAITFTNKAAAEMRERVLSRLKDHALAPAGKRRNTPEQKFWTPPRAAAAVDMLIRSYSALNIRTIDSLLHLMVRLCALDFDLSPDFEPRFSESDISGPIFDLMAEQARDGDDALAELFHRACEQLLHSENMRGFLAGDRIRERVTGMVSLLLNADGWSLRDLASPAEAEAHLRGMVGGIEQNARDLLQRIASEKLDANKRFLKALMDCAECGGSASRLPDSSYFKKASIDECLNKASKGAASFSVHALYDSLRDDLNEVRILIKARRLMPFAELAQAEFERLEDFERRSGIIAASQIPRLAIRTADDSDGANGLFCRMGSRISHILIDEFQDTSRDQWFAIQPLAEEALSRGGTLTIVGDVKQAIYGWRGGDAALFDTLVSTGPLLDLVEKPRIETLPHNWRSRERIVAWNNALFSPIGESGTASSLLRELAEGHEQLLEEQADLLRKAFVRSSQSAEQCRPGGSVHLRWLDKGQENAILLQQIPDLVEKLGRTHAWGDICILARSNDQASLAASWLMARHIPVVTQGSLLLAEQPAVAELVSLLRFLNTPEDDLAFWNVLAGRHLLPPLLDALGQALDLPRLADWASARPLTHTLARQFAIDFPEAWGAVFAPLLEEAGLLTPYDSAMEVLQRWDVIARLPESEGFLRRFLEVLFSMEEQGVSDLSGFLDWWDENGGKEKAPLPESMEAVRIMTMHKAKGLEFDVVILPWMEFPLGRASDDKAMFWDSRGTGVLAPLCKEMGEPWLKHRMDTARESLHLIYVAMTRAVSELYCFLPDPECGPVPAMLDELISRLHPQMKEIGQTAVWGDGTTADEPHEEENTPAPLQETPPAIPPFEEKAPAPDAPLPEAEEAWRPMGWLPRLRMFRSPLEDWSFTARRRGTLVHHCLECLQVSGIGRDSARRDAKLAAARGLSTFPLPVPDKEAVLADITEDLAWYAALPETPHWLACGTPEHPLLDSEGRQFRVDLLVDDGHELVAVEYKTGTPGELPAPSHVEQLSRYLNLLREASDLPVRGVLVYLDRRTLIPLEYADGASHA